MVSEAADSGSIPDGRTSRIAAKIHELSGVIKRVLRRNMEGPIAKSNVPLWDGGALIF